jgi:hypothetical protein
MKKLITILFLLAAIYSQGQTKMKTGMVVGPDSQTMKANVTAILSNGENIGFYVSGVLASPLDPDSALLLDQVKALPYITLGGQTAATISTLTGMDEGTFVWDLTYHELAVWNGTEWRIFTTTKAIHY